nr:LOB domain-containing protein 12-like [Ipomoea batatas]
MAAGASNSPCASCKLLRRRCAKDCIFAPHFPSDDPHKFAIVHKVFGASNVSKMLQEIPADHRADAVSSLVYEANARLRDPVYGCVGAITYLQNQQNNHQCFNNFTPSSDNTVTLHESFKRAPFFEHDDMVSSLTQL